MKNKINPLLPNLLIFTSGSPTGGSSGARKLVEAWKDGKLYCNIAGIVSNNSKGGAFALAKEYGLDFTHFPGIRTAEDYQQLVADKKANFVALSGWMKPVQGLDPRTTFNIHPGPLPEFGGQGMYGQYVHIAVMEAYRQGKVFNSAVTMHFVTSKYDDGPIFFECSVPIMPNDTWETLAARVNKKEHEWQYKITDMILRGEISWDGKDPKSLVGAMNI